jgi:hypothetical protein
MLQHRKKHQQRVKSWKKTSTDGIIDKSVVMLFMFIHLPHRENYSVFEDPDPDVFGPSGSGFFHHQDKTVRKTLISTIS